MTQTELLKRIPAQDWEATPVSVQALLLSLLPLETEVSVLRAHIQASRQSIKALDVGLPENDGDRYQELVEKLLLSGLSAEEAQEMEQLGLQIDAESAPFYEAALQRMEAASHR